MWIFWNGSDEDFASQKRTSRREAVPKEQHPYELIGRMDITWLLTARTTVRGGERSLRGTILMCAWFAVPAPEDLVRRLRSLACAHAKPYRPATTCVARCALRARLLAHGRDQYIHNLGSCFVHIGKRNREHRGRVHRKLPELHDGAGTVIVRHTRKIADHQISCFGRTIVGCCSRQQQQLECSGIRVLGEHAANVLIRIRQPRFFRPDVEGTAGRSSTPFACRSSRCRQDSAPRSPRG